MQSKLDLVLVKNKIKNLMVKLIGVKYSNLTSCVVLI